MQDESSSKFSIRLQRAMADFGINAAELAEKSCVSKGYLSEIIKGKKGAPSFETCKKIADVLNVSPSVLVFGELGEETSSIVKEATTPYRCEPKPLREPGEPTIMERFAAMDAERGEMLEKMEKIQQTLDELMSLFTNRKDQA